MPLGASPPAAAAEPRRFWPLLPCRRRGILSLHSGCNEGPDGDVTLFFGLSGGCWGIRSMSGILRTRRGGTLTFQLTASGSRVGPCPCLKACRLYSFRLCALLVPPAASPTPCSSCRRHRQDHAVCRPQAPAHWRRRARWVSSRVTPARLLRLSWQAVSAALYI